VGSDLSSSSRSYAGITDSISMENIDRRRLVETNTCIGCPFRQISPAFPQAKVIPEEDVTSAKMSGSSLSLAADATRAR